jgi:hypothetical protein
MTEQIKTTDMVHGPFVVMVKDTRDLKNEDHQVISPLEGFPTKEAALEFCTYWAKQELKEYKEAALAFEVLPWRDPVSFMKYMSW